MVQETRGLVSYELCTITEDPGTGMPRDSVAAIAVTWCSSLPRLFGLVKFVGPVRDETSRPAGSMARWLDGSMARWLDG